MNKTYRILHVVPNMDSGGIENLIMNIYRNIDRDKIQFDFIVHHQKRGHFDDEIEKLGGRIYRFPVLDDKNLFSYIYKLNIFFKEHKEYNVIHGHMASLAYVYLGIAKKNGIPIRIAHSHGTSHLKNLKGYAKFFMFKFAKYNANKYFACSTEAGNYLFNKNVKFDIIPNAIDTELFKYNCVTREKIRKEFGINNKDILIGNVGRFNLQKNHSFIIDIFKEIHKRDQNYKLILVGIGELKKQIEEKVKRLNLDKFVIFAGLRTDIYEIYQGMDVFLMPSLFEGLPLTGIEAQSSNLMCYFSDEITREVAVSDNIKFISLKLSAAQWANEILKKKYYNRENVNLFNENFDIKNVSKQMEKKYLEYNK